MICRMKKVDLRIEPTLLDLGKVVQGEGRKSSITATNHGCLPVAVTMQALVSTSKVEYFNVEGGIPFSRLT